MIYRDRYVDIHLLLYLLFLIFFSFLTPANGLPSRNRLEKGFQSIFHGTNNQSSVPKESGKFSFYLPLLKCHNSYWHLKVLRSPAA